MLLANRNAIIYGGGGGIDTAVAHALRHDRLSWLDIPGHGTEDPTSSRDR